MNAERLATLMFDGKQNSIYWDMVPLMGLFSLKKKATMNLTEIFEILKGLTGIIAEGLFEQVIDNRSENDVKFGNPKLNLNVGISFFHSGIVSFWNKLPEE